jgi:predicted ATPase/transcriptional regulator with XRE-family HTH domain
MPGESEFGEMLRGMRIAAGLSQEELADRAGLSADAIASLERGRRRYPRASTVAALALALGLSSDEQATLTQAARGRTGSPPPSGRQTLVGRDHEISALTAMLRGIRPGGLVSVLGPGGVGKTALVSAVVPPMTPEYRHGVAFVDVSALADVSPVATDIARALRLPDSAGPSPAELARALNAHNALVVLDSGERVPELGTFVADLCRQAPGLTVVVTSRTPLGAEDERRFQLPPLTVPRERTASAIADNPSVQLFVARAQAAAPQFELTVDSAGTVATLCARLGGLPLALELAAARTRLLPVTDLLTRLEHGLEVLSTSSLRLPERHRSLRATLDWTYELLDPATQRLFAVLGVFRGGFSPEAAERIHTFGSTVLDQLDELLDVGLLIRLPGSEGRLGMLDTVGDYVRDLLARQDDWDKIRDRHLAYYLDLAERTHRGLIASRQAAELAMLERDHDNLRAALDWCAIKDDESGLRLAVALSPFWGLHGHLGEGRRQLARALESPGAPEELRRRAQYELARLAFYQGDLTDAQQHALLSLALHRAAGARRAEIANTLIVLGNIARERGDHTAAVEHYQKSLVIYRDVEDFAGVAATLHNLGTTAYRQRDFTRGAALYNESLSIRVRLGDTVGVARCLNGLANVSRESGDLDSAIDYGLRSLTLREELGDRHGQALTLIALASTYRVRGELDQATDRAAQALALGSTVGDTWIIATTLAVMVGTLRDQSLWHRAAQTAGTLSTHLELSGSHLDPADADRLTADLAVIRDTLGQSAYTRAHTLGRTNTTAPAPAIKEARNSGADDLRGH